ncbi:UBN2_3 domain-containing protein [Cephalotus follicularis]|uniref:UBN2_3 domain-containing protein n=1 Tax=Cephalotus follicularis TaxID=3775 RepID=A0A1Q3BMI0_CEPFO|nr:UBN2_3 domain-containing protein [Cephalotus follicularis]
MAQPIPTKPTQPNNVIVDDSNYSLWSQNMSRFLRGQMLCKYIINKEPKSVQNQGETKDAYERRYERLDVDNCKIIIWISNTSILSISQLHGAFDIAQEVWEFIAPRYTTTYLSSQYQINYDLGRMCQKSRQSITSFRSQMSLLRDKLSAPSQCNYCTKIIMSIVITQVCSSF